MTTRDTPFAPGTPCWVDLTSSDVGKARAFYGELFGWTADESGDEFGNYVTFRSEGHQVAGMVAKTAEMGEMPDVWSTYVSTADIDATVATATGAGGTVLMPAMPVGDLGSMAILLDPAGGSVGLWQPGTHTGFGKYNEPGSVSWDEQHSKDFDASKEFYATTFGWTYDVVSDTEDFRYVTGHLDGSADPVIGMLDAAGFLPAEVPTHWAVYFSVADTDAAQAKLAELGGTVIRPAEDTPYGRIADVADPTGAMFKLHAPVADQG